MRRDRFPSPALVAWLLVGVFAVYTGYHTAQAVTASASAREAAQQEEQAELRNDAGNAALRHQEYDVQYQTMLRHARLAGLGFAGLAVGCFALAGYTVFRRIHGGPQPARGDRT